MHIYYKIYYNFPKSVNQRAPIFYQTSRTFAIQSPNYMTRITSGHPIIQNTTHEQQTVRNVPRDKAALLYRANNSSTNHISLSLSIHPLNKRHAHMPRYCETKPSLIHGSAHLHYTHKHTRANPYYVYYTHLSYL